MYGGIIWARQESTGAIAAGEDGKACLDTDHFWSGRCVHFGMRVESDPGRPVRVVSSLGLEPRTHALKGRCSTN